MTPVNVLVAERGGPTCRSLKRSLETQEYQVVTTGDGEQALTKCRENHADIAIIDTGLSDVGALELLAYIRGFSRKTAVIVIAAAGSVAQAVEAMKLGAVDYIEKPVDPKAIQLLCREILLRRKLEAGGSVDDFLGLAEIAGLRNARLERRMYLKTAMLRDLTRPEPYYQLGELYESEGNARQAAHYYFLALDAESTFQPARVTLKRMGYLDGTKSPTENPTNRQPDRAEA